jgi:hypothetical protein
MRTFCLFALAVSLSYSSHAQLHYELGAFLGACNYAGDLVGGTLPRFDQNGLAFGFIGRTNLTEQFLVRTTLIHGTLRGDDYLYEERRYRGFKFETSMVELAAGVEWEPFARRRFSTDARGNLHQNNIISPFFYTGLAIAFARHNVDFSRYEGGSLDPKIAMDRAIGNTSTFFVLPMGLGVKFDISKQLVFGFEFAVHYPFSDYVDGVSFAGNYRYNDWFYFGGGTLTYRFESEQNRR